MPAHGVALAAGLVVLATLPPADTFAVLPAPRGWLVLRGASATGPRAGSNACPRAGAPLRTRMQVQTEEDAKGIAPPAIKQDVVCVEGSSGPVCTIVDEDAPKELTSGEYWFPRVLFLGCCIAYGTNFALGRSMNEALDPSVRSPTVLHAAAHAAAGRPCPPLSQPWNRAPSSPIRRCLTLSALRRWSPGCASRWRR